jgi:hypothetical protein
MDADGNRNLHYFVTVPDIHMIPLHAIHVIKQFVTVYTFYLANYLNHKNA